MVSHADLSRIIQAIYAIALRPDTLHTALTDIHRTLDATGAALTTSDACGGRSVNGASIPAEAGHSYIEYYRHIDYMLQAVEQSPVGAIHSGSHLVALAADSEFNVDWVRPYDMQDGLFVRLTSGPAPTSFLIAAPRRRQPFATPERVQLLDTLVPHLQQALRIQHQMGTIAQTQHDTAQLPDTFRHGLILVAPSARILYANRTADAILSANDGLTTHHGVLQSSHIRTADALRHAAAAAAPAAGGCPTSTSLTCPRPSGRRPHIVHITPHGNALPHSRALVTIVDPDRTPTPTPAMLRQLYRLTPSEVSVAMRIAQGANIKPIADELSISAETVRTHLRHVFEKTQTRRQAELTRLLLTIGP